jgi:hypothetical protein
MTDTTAPAPRSRLAALIAEARRRGRRRNLVLAAIFALVAGSGIWGGLELSAGGPAGVQAPPGFYVVQSQGPVAHQVLETWVPPGGLSVDLATGKTRPLRTTREIWWDGSGSALRFLDRVDGRMQVDYAATCPRSATPNSCWPGFSFQSYWPLDKSRYTREPGVGTFRGRPVIWIAPKQPGGFAAAPGEGDRIGLDPRTHRPVAERRYNDGKTSLEAQVLERTPDIPAGEYAFVVPNPGRFPTDPRPKVYSNGTNPFAVQARHALRERPLWLGESFQGYRLQSVTIGSTFTPPGGIHPKAAPFVRYDYGNVMIMEFNSRGVFGAAGGPRPGTLRLNTPLESSSCCIAGMQLTRGGVFVWAYTDRPGDYVLGRAGALRLARALRPVPQP